MTNIERTEAAFGLQLQTFANRLPNYAATFGLTPAQVAAAQADSKAYNYMLSSALSMQASAHNFTEYKKQLRHGSSTTIGGFPTTPNLGTPPAAVPAGIEKRFRDLVQIIKHNPNNAYNTSIGQDLDIEDVVNTFNPSTGKPVFTLSLTAGGHPTIHYTRGNFDGVEIWKNTGSGFVKLERITLTTYTDMTALPAANVAALWQYKLIFIYKDAVVGAYSDIAGITVNGQTGPTGGNPTTGTPTPNTGNQ